MKQNKHGFIPIIPLIAVSIILIVSFLFVGQQKQKFNKQLNKQNPMVEIDSVSPIPTTYPTTVPNVDQANLENIYKQCV